MSNPGASLGLAPKGIFVNSMAAPARRFYLDESDAPGIDCAEPRLVPRGGSIGWYWCYFIIVGWIRYVLGCPLRTPSFHRRRLCWRRTYGERRGERSTFS